METEPELLQVSSLELKPCVHVRGLGTLRCLFCEAGLPPTWPTCAATAQDIRAANADWHTLGTPPLVSPRI